MAFTVASMFPRAFVKVSSGLGVWRIQKLTKFSGIVGLWNIWILFQTRKIMDIKLDNILPALLRRYLTGGL